MITDQDIMGVMPEHLYVKGASFDRYFHRRYGWANRRLSKLVRIGLVEKNWLGFKLKENSHERR